MLARTLRSFAVEIFQHASKAFATFDFTVGHSSFFARVDYIVPLRLMISFSMIMGNILGHGFAQ